MPAGLSASSAFSLSAGAADGWATRTSRLGANRAISEAQLASSDAGATRRHGFRLSLASFFSASSSDKT